MAVGWSLRRLRRERAEAAEDLSHRPHRTGCRRSLPTRFSKVRASAAAGAAGALRSAWAASKRRLEGLHLASYPDLFVGDCVPFYFCPRSVMLYLIYRGNHGADLSWRAGGRLCTLRPICMRSSYGPTLKHVAGHLRCRTLAAEMPRTQ
ncbi:MAG: DarT ssDNA thymidine ADP-ribosyltransferase family protein [Candidatus Eisenbacteria bacterium]